MMFFALDLKCYNCGVSFKEFSQNPVRIAKRLCKNCKVVDKVVDLGGDDNASCGKCVNFKKYHDKGLGLTNNFWGKCGKGHSLPNEGEYALNSKPLGLVYFEDVCDEFSDK
jgi:hypothetical protein